MIITLTGPTCAGKTTVESELQRMGAHRAISHTTRLPRGGEINGQHYHFVTDEEYDRLEFGGSFIETVKLGSARYAMSELALLDAEQDNRHVAIVVEPSGAAQIHAFCRKLKLPSAAVWIDCCTKVQARRWVSRMTADMLVGKEVVGAYAERLHLMLSQENSWRSDAGFAPDLYTLRLDSSAESPKELALKILALAENL